MPALAPHSPSARAEAAHTLSHAGEALGGGTLTCSSLQPGELVFLLQNGASRAFVPT